MNPETGPPSPRPDPDRRRWFCNRSQIRALAVVVLVVAAVWAARLFFRPATIADPPEPYPVRFNSLADRLDPDTADAGALAVLPGIGPSKAEAIIDFRTARRTEAPGGRVFRSADDLTQVPGIGDTTAGKLRPYLYFPEPAGNAE